MQLGTQVFRDWSEGVINSLRADELPINASPRGINSTLVSTAKGRGIVGKRRGASLLLPYALYEDDGVTLATIKSMYQLNYFNASTRELDPFLFATSKSGQLFSINEYAQTHTEITTSLFNADTLNPVWAQLNNVGYVTDGQQQKKVVIISGTPTVQKHGIDAPTKATSSAVSDGAFFAEAIAGGAMTAATWDVACTYYNSNTGHESNLSTSFTLSVGATQQIRVYWDTTPTDTQVTHIRIYMRKSGPMTEYARLSAWDFAIGSGSPQLFGTAADINTTLLLTFAPETGSNSVPPSTIKGWVVHNSRLFGWDEQNIYWSDITEIGPEPESFRTEAYLPVAPNDGSRITACHRVDDNVLVVMKEGSMYGLYGVDPNSWELRLIDPSVGCIAPKSVVTVEGHSYWWSRSGPMQWDHSSAPNQIGYRLLGETTSPEAILYQNAYDIQAEADSPRRKVLFAFPTWDSAGENNVVIAYNYELNVWETSRWDPFDICSMVLANDNNGRQYVYMGGCFGKIFKWWTADVDGVRTSVPAQFPSSVVEVPFPGGQLDITLSSGHGFIIGQWVRIFGFTPIAGSAHPMEGQPAQIAYAGPTSIVVNTFGGAPSYAGSGWVVFCDFSLGGQVVSATATTLTVATGTNLDKEELLIGQYLYSYLPGAGTYQRRRIIGVNNLELEFDVATPWTYEPDSSYMWVLSGPFFEWDTKWDDSDAPFDQKRYLFAYVDAVCDTGATTLSMDIYTGGTLAKVQRTFDLQVTGSGGVFDESGFDEAAFAAESVSRLKRRVAKVEYTYRFRIRHYENNRQLVLLRLGQEAHLLTERRT